MTNLTEYSKLNNFNQEHFRYIIECMTYSLFLFSIFYYISKYIDSFLPFQFRITMLLLFIMTSELVQYIITKKKKYYILRGIIPTIVYFTFYINGLKIVSYLCLYFSILIICYSKKWTYITTKFIEKKS